jgi:hypothetical protein
MISMSKESVVRLLRELAKQNQRAAEHCLEDEDQAYFEGKLRAFLHAADIVEQDLECEDAD